MPKKKHALFIIRLDLGRVGDVLKKARAQLRYSLRDVARQSNISATQLMRMETGEFEFSIVKLHAACISLGISIADLLEYATLREVDPMLILRSPSFFEALLTQEERLDRGAVSHFSEYMLGIYTAAIWILTSNNPDNCASRIEPPPGNSSLPALLEFGSMVNGFSNIERVATLNALLNDPHSKLKSFRLVHVESLHRFMETKEQWCLKVSEVESIAKILRLRDWPQSH